MVGNSLSVAWPGVRILLDITDLVAVISFLLLKCTMTDFYAVEVTLKACRQIFKDTETDNRQ